MGPPKRKSNNKQEICPQQQQSILKSICVDTPKGHGQFEWLEGLPDRCPLHTEAFVASMESLQEA